MEKIVETKQCKHCQASFEITDRDLEFYDKLSPIFAGKKYAIPTPTFCPDCRQQRRLSRNNEMKLYKRTCGICGKNTVSLFSPDKEVITYCQQCRWWDTWDPIQYGQAYDPNASFIQQFAALNQKVPNPMVSTNYLLDENSDYTNYAGSNKDCYLIFHADFNRDAYYGYGVKNVESSMDMYNVFESNFMYQCVECLKCYDLSFSQDCEECSRSYFLRDCVGCKDCICCVNLRQQQYCIFNQKYSKEDYEQKRATLNLHLVGGLSALETKLQELFLSLPHKCLHSNYNENSEGDYVYYCKNVSKSYNVNSLYDGKFCYQVYNTAKDCYDLYQFGLKTEKIYEWSIVGYESSNLVACHRCSQNVTNLCYCIQCTASSYLFGCVWLRNKEYCILNKQYTKEAYESLVPQIIEKMIADWEWGEFFPSHISPFDYNESLGQEFFPLSKEIALAKWYTRMDKEYAINVPEGTVAIQAKDLPDISSVTDDILNQAIICEITSRPFRIIKSELEYCRQQWIDLPTKHPDQRHKERIALRNPRKLRDRQCAKCGTDIKTSYAPNRPETVYCEQCYNKEIYW